MATATMTPTIDVPDAAIRRVAGLLGAIADPTRLAILLCLRDGEERASQFAGPMGLGRAAVDYHVAQLRARGLVEPRRRGQRVYYAPTAAALRLLAGVDPILEGGAPCSG